MSGWRTLNIENPSRLSLRDDSLLLADAVSGAELIFPVSELARIVVSTRSTAVTARLLEHLAEANVSLIFCDSKHSPACELLPLSRHDVTAGCIMDQAEWEESRKAEIWADLVRMKIRNQIGALEKCGHLVPRQLHEYVSDVEPGDPGNREALAAKVYFSALFGHDFVRHAPDDVNSALNYGYSIVLSAISRALVMFGYTTVLGIHHKSRTNRYNLSCDLIEPFRPFVDVAVYRNGTRHFDKLYKRELISLMQRRVLFGKRHFTLDDAVCTFAQQVCGLLSSGEGELPEVCFD